MQLNSPITEDRELNAFLYQLSTNINDLFSLIEANKVSGATGTFTTVDGKTVTVTNGIITSII